MARIIDENFEGTGYEETWTENVGTGCTLNEDSSIPGTAPSGSGSQCLNYIKVTNFGAYARRDYGSTVNTSYSRFYVYFSALNCGSTAGYGIIGFGNDGVYDNLTANIGFYNDGTDYHWRMAIRTGGIWHYEYSTDPIATGQWYRVEMKIDNTGAGSHELRVDGATVATHDGTLERGSPRYWFLGTGGTYTETCNIYYDLVCVDNADWVGAETTEISPNVYDGVVLSENTTVEEDGFSFGHNTAFTGATDDLTQAFTCEAKAKILVLAIVVAGSTNREYVAPTYNGIDLTQADIVRKYVTSPEQSCELWYMIDPPVSASYNIIIPNSGTRTLWCKATSFLVSGNGDAILDLATGNTGVSANPSVSIVTTTNGALIYGVLGDGRNAAPTAQTGYNINRTLHSTYSDSNQYYIQTSAGSWACGWTCLSDDWCMCVTAFKLSFGISVEECVAPNAVFGRN